MSNLSAAQIEQRREAARARWREYRNQGGATAAGAAAGAGTTAAIRYRKLRQHAAAVRQHAAIDDAWSQRWEKTADAFHRLDNSLNGKKFLRGIQPALRRLNAATVRDLRAHMTEHSEPFPDPDTGETHWASTDAAGERKIRAAIAARRAQAADIAERGHEAPEEHVKGHLRVPDPARPTYFRNQVVGHKVVIPPHTAEALEGELEAPYQGNVLHDHGIHTREQFEAHLVSLDKPSRTHFLKQLRYRTGLTGIRVKEVREARQARVGAAIVDPFVRRGEPYPDRKTRNQLRRELRDHLKTLQFHAWARTEQRREAALAAHQPVVDAALQAARRWRMRGPLGVGLMTAGAVAGAGAAYAVHRLRDQNLGRGSAIAKAAMADSLAKARKPKRDADESAKDLLDTAKASEGDLARRIAGAFREWKDNATDEAIGNADMGGILEHLDKPLADAMEPLDHVTLAGAASPPDLPAAGAPSEPPEPHIIRFGFDLRGPEGAAYARQYRYGRVREITDGQRKLLRKIIIDGQLTGAAPQTIARQVRETIGLTGYQAQTVQNFRAALTGPRPKAAALQYMLRDKRFDRTIERAIREKQPLTEEQISRMVDAYHRRMLAFRAMTIARTETLRAANNGHIATVKKLLAANPHLECVKTWMATMDDRTRPDHWELDRKTVVGIDTPFVCESGEKLRWPHDPRGAAKEVIRCRCILMTSLVPRNRITADNATGFGEPFPDFWSGPKEPRYATTVPS